jgi:predicted DNA-binding protein
MSAQVVLTLPDEVLQRAKTLARRVGRPVEDVLTETIALSL